MNQKNREQLRAAIADNLNQGKQTHSPTRDLLKQYRPLKGILTPVLERDGEAIPDRDIAVEKSMARGATVAQNQPSPWHRATVVSDATVAASASVESYAEVKGELRVPNTVNFGLFPTLDPFAKAVYYQLYVLAHGFKRETCTIGLAKLAKSVLMSQRKVQDTIGYLEKRKLIQRVGANLGGSSKGNIYRVFLPNTLASPATVAGETTSARPATLAPGASNKDDDLEIQSSSTESEDARSQKSHLDYTRETYCQVTGNKWAKHDLNAYLESQIAQVPIERVISTIEAVVNRTAVKVNSFNYFVKEILAIPDPRTQAYQKKRLEQVVRRVRENQVGRTGYSPTDFIEDVKCACVREGLDLITICLASSAGECAARSQKTWVPVRPNLNVPFAMSPRFLCGWFILLKGWLIGK